MAGGVCLGVTFSPALFIKLLINPIIKRCLCFFFIIIKPCVMLPVGFSVASQRELVCETREGKGPSFSVDL